MNSQQMKMPEITGESGDRKGVHIPTYAYFNAANETTGDTTFKNQFDGWVNDVCKDINPDQGAVSTTALKDALSADGVKQAQKDLYDQFYKKNWYKADNVVGSVVAGVSPSFDGSPAEKDNQIKYLACQVAKMHAREYDSNAFAQGGRFGSIKEVFTKFASMKPYLALIFFISVYLYVQGIMSSMDVGYNVATNLFKGESSSGINFWIGSLVGVAIPFAAILAMFSAEICKSLMSEERYEIQNNPYGEKQNISNSERKMDYWMMALFVLFIYGFMGILYTIGSIDKKANWLVSAIIFGVLLIITVFIYIFYNHTPFLATAADEEGETSQKRNRDVEIYVKKIDDVDEVKTSVGQERYIKHAFIISAVIIILLAVGFFFIHKIEGPWAGFLKGMFGSGAILALPVIWVFNTVLAFNYFYLYPIVLIVARGVRYLGMMALLGLGGKNEKVKEWISGSSNLSRQMGEEGIREYSPTWNLIGVSFLKTMMQLAGLENNFSKQFVESNSYSSNLSQDSYVAGFYLLKLATAKDKNKSTAAAFFSLIVVSIIIWAVVLYGVVKV